MHTSFFHPTPLTRILFPEIFAAIALLAAGSASAAPVQGFVTGLASGGSEVRTYLGVSTTPTSDFLSMSPSYTGGVFVGGSDLNSDGVADTIAGAATGAPPTVKAFSGQNGSTLANFSAFSAAFAGGGRVAGGDINHDGFADIIAGAGPGGGPQISVFSGKDGSLLSSFFAFSPSFTGGVFVAGGDVNHDGFSDIIAGAGAGGSPQVAVFSGKDGSTLSSFLAFSVSFTGGVTVASGDVNGDGFSDIIVGAGPGGGPQVSVFSGKDGSLLESFFAFAPSYTGGVNVAAADLNGDGKADIITATGPGAVGEVKAFDGNNQSTLLDFEPFGSAYTGGVTVAGLVPEPASGTLALLGGLGLFARRRRR